MTFGRGFDSRLLHHEAFCEACLQASYSKVRPDHAAAFLEQTRKELGKGMQLFDACE